MSNQYGPRITTSGLVFNMDFGNSKCYPGTGNNCYDLSANTLIGELGNFGVLKPTYNKVINNGYFSFVGPTSPSFIRIPNSTALDSNEVSVEVWIKTDNGNQNGFWFEKGTVNTQYSLFQEGLNVQWRHNISGVGLTTLATNIIYTNLNSVDWFHFCGTYISGSRKLYVNGVLKNSDTRTGNISVNSGGMSIGAYGGYNGGRSYYYDGNLAIVRVYNRSLEPYEVVNNFNANRKRFGV